MTKISDLTAAGTLTGAELVPVVQSGSTVRTTVTNLLAAAPATPAVVSDDLLKVSNTDLGLDASLRALVDGNGVDAPLQLSTSAVMLPEGVVWPYGDSSRYSSGQTGIIIPFYIYPNNPYTDPVVARLLGLIRKYREIPVIVVINPSSGPGAVWDGNYAAFIRVLRAVGACVAGYVSTDYAVRPAGEVQADINAWLTLYADTPINTIFMDEQPYDLVVGSTDTVALYKSYTDYCHARNLAPVIGNPGTNQRGEHFESRTADIIVVNEVATYPSEASMLGNFVGGHVDYRYTLRAAMVYGQTTLVPGLVRQLAKYVQYVLITDDVLPNPWDSLPTYLEQLFAILAGRETLDVGAFGAVGDGVVDDSTAFMAAFAVGRAAGGGVITIPPGTFNLASMTASVTLRVFSGCTVRGAGYTNSTLIWNDDSGISLIRGPTSGRCTDVILEDFAIRGTQDTRGNTGAYPILITSCDNLHIRRLLVEKSRVFGMAIRSSRNVTVQDCVVRLCGRDGINVAQATRYIITGNHISNCDDDGIAAHTDPSDPEGTPNGGVITGNILFDVQGIKVLGARHCIIADNTLDCCKAQGITVACDSHDGVTQEGVASMLNIIITDNKITNVLDRTAIDALNAGNNYINIGGAAAQAGTLNAVPGENYPTGGTIIPYYDYVNNNSIATTTPTPGSNGVIISNNILSRTLKGGVAFSTYGRGLIFSRGGWYDPVFTTAQVGQSGGVQISSGYLRNVSIIGNVFTGLSTGVSIGTLERLGNLSIKHNTFWDILSYGILFNTVSSGKIVRAYIESNIIDMDPLHVSSNRSVNGTWLALGSPTGIQFQSGDGGALIRGNVFRNLCRDTDKDSSAINTYARWENNYVEADPSVMGSFSTSNKGIGLIRRDGGVSLIHTDSDPASATYGQVLTYGALTATAIPTTGTYLAGTFVRNTSATYTSGRLILGWHRMTTGSAHVSGTDWHEIGLIQYATAGVVTLTRTDSATNSQLMLAQAGSGDSTLVWELTGTKAYAMGIDNSDSDKLKIATANNSYVSVALEMNTTGDITLSNGNLSLTPRATAPSTPAEGMLAYADGSGWNPGGTGAGVYAYISAAWVKL
jgi:hypothetical protein